MFMCYDGTENSINKIKDSLDIINGSISSLYTVKSRMYMNNSTNLFFLETSKSFAQVTYSYRIL